MVWMSSVNMAWVDPMNILLQHQMHEGLATTSNKSKANFMLVQSPDPLSVLVGPHLYDDLFDDHHLAHKPV